MKKFFIPLILCALLPYSAKADDERLISRQGSVYVTEIRITSPVLQTDIESLSQPLLNREIPIDELMAFKNSVNELFATKGYINTGVRIPDQKIKNGIVEFNLIEGEISAINVDSELRNNYVVKRLNLTSPFNLVDLQASLKLLERDPFVRRIDANVTPGLKPGAAEFSVSVETRPKFKFGIHFANNRSPAVGSENTELTLSTHNLTGWGDVFSATSSITEGLDSNAFSFSIPFNHFNHSIRVDYTKSDSSVIEEPFASIDVESETESLSIGLDFPVLKTLEDNISFHLIFETRKNQTYLLDQTFSFSEGAINGESRVSPVRLAASFSRSQAKQSIAGRLSVSKGTSNFDATENTNQADGDFTSYLAQLQYSKSLGERFVLSTRLLAQYASNPLLSIEKFSLGGLGSVRGYRQNQIVRDNTYLASIEGRYRLKTDVFIELLVFADWGSGENHDDAISQGKDSISSVGVGVSFRGIKGLSADLYLAHGFKDISVRDRNLQDDGIHFQLRYEHVF
ncbi:MAG: hemolysin activation/secretion protein [Candidatus Azotimanducaceae bacterium]|jgi:hemolysin activation/secretion protein